MADKCDISDLVCQMQVLGHLKSMQSVLGDERFKTEFPDFANLKESLSDKISVQEGTLEESMRRCGLLTEDEPASSITMIAETPTEIEMLE